jgi:hypothetical protein
MGLRGIKGFYMERRWNRTGRLHTKWDLYPRQVSLIFPLAIKDLNFLQPVLLSKSFTKAINDAGSVNLKKDYLEQFRCGFSLKFRMKTCKRIKEG